MCLLSGLLMSACTAHAQNQQFVFTLYGGLFFPSNMNFKSTYQSSSDLMWGAGLCLPMRSYLYTTVDYAYFHTQSLLPSTNDSTMELDEQFLHVGILDKQRISGNIYFRLSGGLSYTKVKQSSSSPDSPKQTKNADKRLGYFGGIGLEQQLDEQGHIALFGDLMYDYRRSRQKDLCGDFGGVRLILGVHLFLF